MRVGADIADMRCRQLNDLLMIGRVGPEFPDTGNRRVKNNLSDRLSAAPTERPKYVVLSANTSAALLFTKLKVYLRFVYPWSQIGCDPISGYLVGSLARGPRNSNFKRA